MKRPGDFVWFFITPSGSLVSEFARTEISARFRLYALLGVHPSELMLVETPIEEGRITWEVGF